jgi:aminopeptidase N
VNADSTHRHACAHRRAATFTLPGAETHYPPDLEIEPVHLDIDLRVDIEARSVVGVVTHTLEWRRTGAVQLDLHAIDFNDVALEDLDGHQLRWRYDGRCIRVTWASGAERGATRRLAIAYRVVDPISGLFFSAPHAHAPDAPRFAATDHETERARHWLPTIDLPSVRPTLAFHLRAPAELTILANGLQRSEELHEDGSKTAHWQLEQPCPSYLTCFVIGELVECNDGDHLGDGTGVPLAYYTAKTGGNPSGRNGRAGHTVDHLSRTFGGTAEIMRWMTEKQGSPFPFPKYFQFALPDFNGAMENISLVSWDDQFLLDETLAGEWGRLIDQINVHEMAHSWFGDLVVCRDYAHAWLKESWATYMEACWFEDVIGRDEQHYELWLNAQAYFREADCRYTRPLVIREFHNSFELYDMHLYPGGAMRLHTLRSMLGDEVFWEGTRAYLREYAGTCVETDDFRRTMERVSGRSLGKFFDQWIHSCGYPVLEAEFEWDEAHHRGTFTIKQTQASKPDKADKPDASAVGLFSFPLTLAWTIDGKHHQRRVEVERERHGFAFEMDSEPDMVRVDPDFQVLHKLEFDPGADKLEAQLCKAPDVLGRILAGRELIKQGKHKHLAMIGQRWSIEPFWGVRLEWARSLGQLGSQAAITTLIHAISSEKDHRVLEGLLRACMDLRDAELMRAVVDRFEKGLPHRAASAAWELLGAYRDRAPYELISAAADRNSYNGFEQSGALRALAATRDDRALDHLIARSQPGTTSDRARPAAAYALGVLARRLDKRARERAIERLVDLLRDQTPRVRLASAYGLEAARATEAMAQLEAYRATLTHQDQVRVDRILAGLRKGDDARVGAAEKELEELREKVRKLEARVEQLHARVNTEG